MRSVLGRLWYHTVHRVDILSAITHFIRESLSFENSLINFNSSDSASAILELINIPENGFWNRKNQPVVILHDVAAYSSQIDPAEKFLLLGAEDHEKMRLLIAPFDGRTPVIKTLSLTFAEARARLEKGWQRLHAKPQDQDLGETKQMSSG